MVGQTISGVIHAMGLLACIFLIKLFCYFINTGLVNCPINKSVVIMEIIFHTAVTV